MNDKWVPENELLVPFESQNLPEEYKEYYLAKRQNLFASIQQFSEIYSCYMLLDRIWFREFQDLKVASDPNRLFPLMLYLNAHAKIRVCMELALSGCLAEARSILRDAIEFVAHAHHMLSDPNLQLKWLGKNDDAEQFKAAFKRNKKTGLFKDLDELHKTWGDLSETGSHATLNAMCDRFETVDDGSGNMQWRLNYSGIEPRMWGMQLFGCCWRALRWSEHFFWIMKADLSSIARFSQCVVSSRPEKNGCEEN